MTAIEQRIAIAAPPAAVWAIAGEVGDADAWIGSIERSWMDGDLRYAELDGGRGTVVERIIFHSDAERRYEYELVGEGAALREFRGSFAVGPAADGSEVVWAATLTAAADADEDQVARRIEANYARSLETLRDLVLAR